MRLSLLSVAVLLLFNGLAQTTDLPLGHIGYQQLDQLEVLKPEGFFTSIKPYSRKDLYTYLRPKNGSYLSMETVEYAHDSTKSKKSIFQTFYKSPQDLYRYSDQSLNLHVNPVLHFGLGADQSTGGRTTFINTRGFELRGTIDGKVAFYSYLTENQADYPLYVNHVRDSTLVVPYEGFWKQYRETGVDFLRAQGYIDFALSNSISAQFGYGKHFVGNGQRSLILSDYANNYPYLRINTETKIFNYTNLFAELIADVQGGTFGTSGVGVFTTKYMAMHHLNMKIRPNLHVGVFESVMFGDSTGGFKIAYLNPIIFYRSIEQQNGSADNSFVGVDFKWNIRNRLQLYGQFVIDELIVSNVLEGNEWWGNKQGIQLGAKYANAFGIKNLMMQGELNRVRPYMYAHENGFTSYSHYNLALAHPLGANFSELIGRMFYTAGDHWQLEMHLLLAKYGNDLGGVNYGRDILKNYTERVPNGNGGSQEYGVKHLQGNLTNLNLFFFRTSYMIKHNLFLDLDYTFRNEKDETSYLDLNSSVIGFSIRLNTPSRTYLF